jgi:3-oxosteroid 1-dehydrogenase
MAQFDETFDWVVVGSGAGSMPSALLMRQAGKSVLILEKADVVGGTTCKSGGVMWIPNNRFMAEDGETDSVEAAMTYLDALQELDGGEAPGSTPAKRRAYVTQGSRMLEFLIEQGIELQRGHEFWPDYYDELPGGCKTTRTVVAKPFDLKELGPWREKLRKGFVEVNATLSEGMQLGHSRTNPGAKKMLAKIALRTIGDKLRGRQYTTAGACLQGRLLKASLDAGVDVRTESPVKEIILDDSGRAVGVLTEKDGKPWRVGANLGVLVNAGGFAQNQAMRDKYIPGSQAKWSQTPESDTGDMHIELERIGGVLAQMDQMVGFQMSEAPGSENDYVKPGMQSVTAKPHAILVDQSGERYMNEGGSYELYCENMLKRNREVPAIPSWGIFDQQYAEKYQVAGKWVDKKIPKAWQGKNYLHKADTIEGLAQSIGVPAEKLKATVERWNGFARAGKDEDFQRGERLYDQCGYVGDPFSQQKSIGTIEKGPFYAVPVVPGDVSTYGGVVTDEFSRVLKEDGSVIEGLYATGVTTASAMGNVYPGAGASVGPSMTFGWIAAKHAAGLGNQYG